MMVEINNLAEHMFCYGKNPLYLDRTTGEVIWRGTKAVICPCLAILPPPCASSSCGKCTRKAFCRTRT